MVVRLDGAHTDRIGPQCATVGRETTDRKLEAGLDREVEKRETELRRGRAQHLKTARRQRWWGLPAFQVEPTIEGLPVGCRV